MAKLGIITGLVFEADLLRGHTSDRLMVRAAGLAPGAARKAAEALVDQGATALMSFGIAGGLDPVVEAGTAIIAGEIRGDRTIACDPTWNAHMSSLLGSAPVRPLAHAARVLATPAEKAALFATSGAAAADMESYGIAETAAARGIPFAALRVVADTAIDSVPAVALQGMGLDGRVRVGASITGALLNLGQIPELIRLGRRTDAAKRVLARLADAGAPRLFGLV